MNDIGCNGLRCTVSQWDWNAEQNIVVSPANRIRVNIGKSTRPVWLQQDGNGITLTTDTEFGCGGTVLKYNYYYFQVNLDATCSIDRGLAIVATTTGLSPLYDETFGLCAHLDAFGITQSRFRTASDYSTAGRRHPVTWARCLALYWWEFFSHSN